MNNRNKKLVHHRFYIQVLLKKMILKLCLSTVYYHLFLIMKLMIRIMKIKVISFNHSYKINMIKFIQLSLFLLKCNNLMMFPIKLIKKINFKMNSQ
jgi:hypothetical protein